MSAPFHIHEMKMSYDPLPPRSKPPLDTSLVDVHIPTLDMGEVVRCRGQDMLVVGLEKAGAVLSLTELGGFDKGDILNIKGYYWRVLSASNTTIAIVPHGRSKRGVYIDENNVVREKPRGMD